MATPTGPLNTLLNQIRAYASAGADQLNRAIEGNKGLREMRLGLMKVSAGIGQLAGRAYLWLQQLRGPTAKTDTVGRPSISNPMERKPSQGSSENGVSTLGHPISPEPTRPAPEPPQEEPLFTASFTPPDSHATEATTDLGKNSLRFKEEGHDRNHFDDDATRMFSSPETSPIFDRSMETLDPDSVPEEIQDVKAGMEEVKIKRDQQKKFAKQRSFEARLNSYTVGYSAGFIADFKRASQEIQHKYFTAMEKIKGGAQPTEEEAVAFMNWSKLRAKIENDVMASQLPDEQLKKKLNLLDQNVENMRSSPFSEIVESQATALRGLVNSRMSKKTPPEHQNLVEKRDRPKGVPEKGSLKKREEVKPAESKPQNMNEEEDNWWENIQGREGT